MKVFGSMISLVVIAAAVAGCKSSEPVHTAATETLQARVVESKQEQAPDMVRTTGTLHAHESATLSAQVMDGFSRCSCTRAMP